MSIDDDISKIFKQLAAQKKIRVQAVAAAGGVPAGTLYRVVRGDARWTSTTIEAAARGLGVSPRELLPGPDIGSAAEAAAALRRLAAWVESLEGSGTDPRIGALVAAVQRKDLRSALGLIGEMGIGWEGGGSATE